MDIKLFHLSTYNWGYEGGMHIYRPGINLGVSWHAHVWRLRLSRFLQGFRWDLGPLVISGVINPELWFVRTAKCSNCGRLWPAESRSPKPGDPAWEEISPETRFRGQWLQDVDRVVDGKLFYKPYRWIGMCCELNMSGMFGGDEREGDGYDDYDEYG